MNHDKNGTLQYALDLWVRMMNNNFAEVRALWYPAASPGLVGRQVVSENAWEDIECSCEAAIVACVEGAVKSLTATQRGALEHHLGLSAVVMVRDYDERLEEALQKVWLSLLVRG